MIEFSTKLLSQSLDDLGTTLGECLGRTRWSSSLDCTTYLYYFYKWLYTTSPRSHVLSRMFYNHMTCHMIWLHKFPCYLYLVFVEWLDIYDQVFECVGNFLLLRALITKVVFKKLPDQSKWDYTIKLIPNTTLKNCKIYLLNVKEQEIPWRTLEVRKNQTLKIALYSFLLFCKKKGWLATTSTRLSMT